MTVRAYWSLRHDAKSGVAGSRQSMVKHKGAHACAAEVRDNYAGFIIRGVETTRDVPQPFEMVDVFPNILFLSNRCHTAATGAVYMNCFGRIKH